MSALLQILALCLAFVGSLVIALVLARITLKMIIAIMCLASSHLPLKQGWEKEKQLSANCNVKSDFLAQFTLAEHEPTENPGRR